MVDLPMKVARKSLNSTLNPVGITMISVWTNRIVFSVQLFSPIVYRRYNIVSIVLIIFSIASNTEHSAILRNTSERDFYVVNTSLDQEIERPVTTNLSNVRVKLMSVVRDALGNVCLQRQRHILLPSDTKSYASRVGLLFPQASLYLWSLCRSLNRNLYWPLSGYYEGSLSFIRI